MPPRLRSRFYVFFAGGLDVTSPKRVTLMLAAAAAVTIASSLPSEAQIIYPFPPYRYPGIHPDASVRLDVEPQDTEVYVDGYYAGIVDDFDGMLQRLRVEPGQHEITLYHDGYRAAHQRVYLTRDRTFKIRQQLEMLSAGEAAEPRPIPAPLPAGAPPPLPLPRNGRGTPPNLPPSNAPPAQAGAGRLSIQVQPADATVLIDGQPWPASPGQETVILDLPEGRHVIQVRKPGYVGYSTEVDVRRGETATVNVSLRPQP
jgi:PEGA domain-containing protein